MSPVRQTVPSHSQAPSGNYLVMLHDHVDLSSFKETLPADIQSKIKSEWSVVNAKGIAGPFDETARDILSQHADVKSIHKSGRLTTADSGTASGKRSENKITGAKET